MADASSRAMWLDRAAIGLSGLCLAHCIGTAVLVALVASAGGVLLHHSIHEIGLGIALLLGILGLGRGYLAHRSARPVIVGGAGLAMMAVALTMAHGPDEMWATMAGVSLVAIGHHLNRRALGRARVPVARDGIA